ncbi:hypothetical protein [Aliikangiella coralliicola]|uniref:carnosine N-methyltransferase n=1 Tax=Aliikangiella coralliicola TaxID=2592383 RepID=A0A545UAT6_9GAMM|nr:hypothetical protein [Aliikangiella coralliicola]TQV86567.1 hypothetical protein FLL46_16830 [Aliikangiella coralliicola]
MEISEELLAVLSCPQSALPLTLKDKQLVTVDEQIHYPIINQIPWLLRNPLHSMVDWSVKLNHFNQVLSDEIRQLNNEIKKAPKPTLARLQLLLKGKQAFQQSVSHLVSPILKAKVSSKPVYDALSDRAPHTQNLLSYESNLYRDWVWGEEENQITADILLEHTKDISTDSLLVLGAGSCRLAYDLHQAIAPKMTVANDINPLLLFAAHQLFSGRSLPIYEFPVHPRNAQSVAIEHKISPLKSWPDNFYMLFSDAATPALKKSAFELVVTPWLIDIQPFELVTFMRAINHYLPIGAHWLNFGSLVFNQKRDSFCYAIDEVKEMAAQAGFEIADITEHEIPYLKSPYSAGYRVERVWCWRAVKTQEVKAQTNLQNLPDWIVDISKTIPLTREIKSFSFNHSLYAELTALIDGKKSIHQIAKKVAREKSMDENEAISMVKNFYLKIVQQSL